MLFRSYSCDEELLKNCLDAFDGGTASFIDGIRVNRSEGFNSALCYELGTNALDRDYARNSEIFTKIATLYGFSKSSIESWLKTFGSVFSDRGVRICYQLKQSKDKKSKDLEVLLLPIDRSVFMTANIAIIENLKNAGLITELQANDLKDWNDYTLKTLSHFNLRLTQKKGKIETEVSAFYGLILKEMINPPYRETIVID